jgi:hypothetical protein
VTRRKLAMLAFLLTAATLVGFGLWLVLRDGGVSKARFEQVTDRMGLAEVVAILGPPADESPSGRNWSEMHNGPLAPGHVRLVWGGDHGAGIIVFDEQRRARHLAWEDSPETFVQMVRRRLPWLPL